MTDEKAEKSWTDFTLRELYTKRMMARFFIKQLRQWETEGEDASQGLAQYRSDLEQINAAIREKKWNGAPPAQTVGVQTLRVRGKAPGR